MVIVLLLLKLRFCGLAPSKSRKTKKPAATFSRKVAAGFEIFLRLSSTSPGDAHKLSRSRFPIGEAVRKSEIIKASVMHFVCNRRAHRLSK
jgi:hypothetical protein